MSRVSQLCEDEISISYNFTPYSDLWETRRIIAKSQFSEIIYRIDKPGQEAFLCKLADASGPSWFHRSVVSKDENGILFDTTELSAEIGEALAREATAVVTIREATRYWLSQTLWIDAVTYDNDVLHLIGTAIVTSMSFSESAHIMMEFPPVASKFDYFVYSLKFFNWAPTRHQDLIDVIQNSPLPDRRHLEIYVASLIAQKEADPYFSDTTEQSLLVCLADSKTRWALCRFHCPTSFPIIKVNDLLLKLTESPRLRIKNIKPTEIIVGDLKFKKFKEPILSVQSPSPFYVDLYF